VWVDRWHGSSINCINEGGTPLILPLNKKSGKKIIKGVDTGKAFDIFRSLFMGN
jgi:hypothetical protein